MACKLLPGNKKRRYLWSVTSFFEILIMVLSIRIFVVFENINSCTYGKKDCNYCLQKISVLVAQSYSLPSGYIENLKTKPEGPSFDTLDWQITGWFLI